jgi:hypothetical protein
VLKKAKKRIVTSTAMSRGIAGLSIDELKAKKAESTDKRKAMREATVRSVPLPLFLTLFMSHSRCFRVSTICFRVSSVQINLGLSLNFPSISLPVAQFPLNFSCFLFEMDLGMTQWRIASMRRRGEVEVVRGPVSLITCVSIRRLIWSETARVRVQQLVSARERAKERETRGGGGEMWSVMHAAATSLTA